MIDKTKLELGNKCVDKLIECRTFDEIKTAISAFLAAVDAIRDECNGILVWNLCHQLTEALAAWAKPYNVVTAPRSSKTNTILVSPEHAPLMLLKSSIPMNGSPNDILTTLNGFIARCDEFVPPICDAITETEIKRVLNAAQKSYRLLDIIAPNKPLKILRFDYSHTVYNSQCGLSDDKTRPATIMVYHPRETKTYDRVFIFAHELGHALHKALTGDVSIAPEGFDTFNKPYAAKLGSVHDMQECFADAAALAILNIKGLGTHFPTQWSKDISPNFAWYFRGLCESALKKAGAYTEPLPPPNLMWQAALYPPR